MGGHALHLCNPGSEVEGADGAGDPSTGLVNPPQDWSVKLRGSWGGLGEYQCLCIKAMLQSFYCSLFCCTGVEVTLQSNALFQLPLWLIFPIPLQNGGL